MKFLVILRHRMKKSETTVWSISFLIMNLMAKLDHLISNRRKFFMLFMLGEKIILKNILKSSKTLETLVLVFLLAPTGVSAINIDGATIHSGLNIPHHGKMFPLSEKNWASLSNKYSEVQLIDKISMVPSKFLFQVHQRLN